MRNGYFILVEGKKIKGVFTTDMDMSPSNYGLVLLEKIFDLDNKEDVSDFVDLIEEFDNFEISDFVKNKDNKNNYFEDYNYIYDTKRKILKLYYSGVLLYSISISDLELYRFVFENDEILYKIFSFNQKKRTMDNDFVKEFKKYLKTGCTILDLKNKISSFKSRLFINSCNIEDCWNESYKKVVEDMDYNDILTFIISKEFGKYSLSIQFPYIRKSISRNISSARKAESMISDILKNNEDDILVLNEIFKMYEGYYSKISYTWKNMSDNKEKVSSLCVDNIKIFENDLKRYTEINKCFNITDSIKQEMVRELYSLNRMLYNEKNKKAS